MNLLKQEQAIRNEIFEYFGYVEDWRVLPFDDATEYYWFLSGEGRGDVVKFAETPSKLASDGDYYQNEIYTNRHLPKWVYYGKDYTMICVDTRTDGNQFLQIFDNSKRLQIEKP